MVEKKSQHGSKRVNRPKHVPNVLVSMVKTQAKQTGKTPEPTKKELTTSNLEFQICDWNYYHEVDGVDEEETEKYVIQLFGRTADDADVCLKVTDFTPFFYVEIPMNWTKREIDRFVLALQDRVSWVSKRNPNNTYDLGKSLIFEKVKVVNQYKFYHFSNKKMFKFIRLVFNSYHGMHAFANVLAHPVKLFGVSTEPVQYQRYESNIEPHIRFMHINNLSSCGWVSLTKLILNSDQNYSYCDYSYSVHWKNVKPSTNDDRIAPLKIMAYDIECISCDHNFPQANRTTDKIIQIGLLCTVWFHDLLRSAYVDTR